VRYWIFIALIVIVAGYFWVQYNIRTPRFSEYFSEKEFRKLEAPLIEIDPILLDFARRHNMQLDKNAKGWPVRELNWDLNSVTSRGKQIAIFVSPEGKNYDFCLAAGEHRGNENHYRKKMFHEHSPWSVIQANLANDLENAFKEGQSWKFEDLPLVGFLSRG